MSTSLAIAQLQDHNTLWQEMLSNAEQLLAQTPALNDWLQTNVFQHQSFQQALSHQLACKLHAKHVPMMGLKEQCMNALSEDPSILHSSIQDLLACYERDPACEFLLMPLLYFKGYLVLQAQRVAHHAWNQGHKAQAYFLQSQMSTVFSVDIHPAVSLGYGIMLDHATGVVMGETTVVGNNVSILHSVTLGGCGTQTGIRHPNIGDDVLIGAGAKILGAVHIGEGVQVASGSLVLEDVPPHRTVAGVPARIVGRPKCDAPSKEMNQGIDEDDDSSL